MDPTEEYPSDSDASDEDFAPEKEEPGSEEESDNDPDPESESEENGQKKRKRSAKTAGSKKAKVAESESAEPEKELDEDEEERMTDALWADFLAGTEGNKSSAGSSTSQSDKKQQVKKSATVKPPEKPKTVTKIYEFAGETVQVTGPSETETIEKAENPSKPASLSTNGGTPRAFAGRSSGGGLGAVLNQLGKKNKLSTLEKTQLDWKSFKRTEGIEEELQTHNRGRDGYLERQDFLQRADVRQFEIEKQFRQSKSKR